jgi:NCS1 family nucleobase:cation symporter-1
MATHHQPLRDDQLELTHPDPRLINEELKPLKSSQRRWGWFEIFNVWSNDIQSLAGYTLAASLFITAGINGWAVFAAIILSGFVVQVLVDLSGRPSVKYGFPYPVLSRASMGIHGAHFPAMLRAIVAIFWYGAQTYFASTAIALALNALLGSPGGGQFLGLDTISWVSYIIASGLQVLLFAGGIDRIGTFLNIAGPAVYVVMIALVVAIWVQIGSDLPDAVANVFSQADVTGWAWISAFFGVMGTMIAYFAAVVINYGDFARNVRTDRAMRVGNFTGLPLSLALFTFLSVFITAGSYVLYQEGQGEPMTNPTDIVAAVDNTALTILAAITFLVATVGINVVANFIPPVYSLSNLSPRRFTFSRASWVIAGAGFIIGGLWVAVIDEIGLPTFVDTLGALLAPLYGIIIADYYNVRKQKLNLQDLYSSNPDGAYWFVRGWNRRAIVAFAISAVLSLALVWTPALADFNGFAWVLGALAGGVLHRLVMGRLVIPSSDADY